MNCWYIRVLKLRYVIACAVVTAGLAITPYLEQLAYEERGYKAVGGEYAPLVFSFLVAAIIIQVAGEIEANYRRRLQKGTSEGGRGVYADKMQKMQENTEGPGINRNGVRQGLRVEVECKSEKHDTLSETRSKTIEARH